MWINYKLINCLQQINQSCGYVVRLSSRSPQGGVSFIGEFLPNFDLKNMILTSIKDFSQKKKTQILQKNCQIFNDKFQ